MQMFNRDVTLVEPVERSEDEWLDMIRSLYNHVRACASSGQCQLNGQSVDAFMDGPGGVLSELSGLSCEELREVEYWFGLQKITNVHDLSVLCSDVRRGVLLVA